MKSNISGVIIVSRGSGTRIVISNAIAILVVQRLTDTVRSVTGNAPGGTDFIFDGSDRSDVRIPAVEIARTGADVILSHLLKNETATVIMRCCEPNVWAIWNASGWMIAYSVIIGGFVLLLFHSARKPGFEMSHYYIFASGYRLLHLHGPCIRLWRRRRCARKSASTSERL